VTGFPAPATDLSLGYGFPETDPVASTGKFDRDSTSKEVSSTFSDAFSWGPVMDLPWRIPASISRVRFMGLVELGARRRSPLTVVGCHGMEEAHRLVATGTGRERR